MRATSALLVVGLIASTTTACIHGPKAFQSSHALHNEALRERIDEELLLNLVRLRYRDSPLFLKVGSVVTQFQIRAALGTSGDLEESGPGSLGVDANVAWSEQPTYTFTPLQDDDFVRRMLTPLDVELVVLLQRSGWSIERVLRLVAQKFAGFDNATSASGPTPERAPEFEDFVRVTRAMRTLQGRGALELVYEERTAELSPPVDRATVLGADLVRAAEADLRFRPVEGTTSQVVLTRTKKKPVLLVSPRGDDDAAVAELAEALGVSTDRRRLELVTGSGSADPGGAPGEGTVGVSTRSLLGIFFYLSHGIDVPGEHVNEGLVTVTTDAEGAEFDWDRLTGDLLDVKTSPSRPKHAAVAVPHRGHWFYVEDSDLRSKSTIALLLELLNLSADSGVGNSPTLTLPVGG